MGPLTVTTIMDEIGPGSNGNEEVLNTPQISRTWNLTIRWFSVISGNPPDNLSAEKQFELGHNAKEATGNNCCTKGGDAIDHITVIRERRNFVRFAWTSMIR